MLTNMMRQWILMVLCILIVSLIVPKILNFYEPYNQQLNIQSNLIPPHIDPAVKKIKPIVQQMKVTIPDKEPLWAVQIGSYKSLASITKTIEKLRKKGFTVQTNLLSTDQGELWRVWVGELISKQAAEDLNKKLHDEYDVNGFVMRLESHHG